MNHLHKYKYFAFDRDEGELEYFETEEQAKKWAQEAIRLTSEADGIGECAVKGGIGWGKIAQHTTYEVTDEKSNYDDPGEDWPYDGAWDEVGTLKLVDVDEETP